MKVFYSTSDHTRLIQGDESVKLYASENHPNIKGKPVRSTAYIGPAERVITNETVSAVEQAVAQEHAPAKEPAEVAPEPVKLTPAQKRAATLAAKKASQTAAK